MAGKRPVQLSAVVSSDNAATQQPRGSGPAVAQFVQHLRAERNASEHTVAGYLSDIAQFCRQLWGEETAPPFRGNARPVFRAAFGVVSESRHGAHHRQPQDVQLALVFRFLVREDGQG